MGETVPVEFDPTAIQAVLKVDGEHWVIELESATGGSWGHADTSWRTEQLPREELREEMGENGPSSDQDVIDFVEVSLRRAGWRAVRSAEQFTPPVLESWELSPASGYTARPKHLFS